MSLRSPYPWLIALALQAGCSPGGGTGPSSGGSSATGATAAGSAASASGGSAIATGGSGNGGAPLMDRPAPLLLSETGLYGSDMVTLADGVHFFEPSYGLWTDTADKKRWVWLPQGMLIDSGNMNFWEYPIGTKLWKEFVRDGQRVETRFLEKQPSGEWVMMAYQWRDDQAEADAVELGQENASGTNHDIPSAEQCGDCHLKVPDKVIGFSAVQLAHAPTGKDPTEWTLESLMAAGLLSLAPESPPFVPGNEVEKAALGYLHANCGHCHNRRSAVAGRVSLFTWLTVESLGGPLEETPAYATMIGVENSLKGEGPSGIDVRIVPGDPKASSAYVRMEARGPMYSMPPLGTEDQDSAGLSIMADWINSLATP